MTFDQLIRSVRGRLNEQVELHNHYSAQLEELRSQDAPDEDRVVDLIRRRSAADSRVQELRTELDGILADKAQDDEHTRDAQISIPVKLAAGSQARGPVRGDEDNPNGDPSTARAGDWINTDTGRPAALRAGQTMGDYARAQRAAEAEAETVAKFRNLGQLVRSITTSGTGAIVPTVWTGDLIDRARAASAVMSAGATIVPMEAGTVKIGRLTGDPTAAFRTEGSAITPSDPTFDNVTLTARSLSALVVGSLEWFQDADNASEVISDAIAKAIAQTIDLAALYGGITADAGTISLATPPNPRGILAALNATLADNVLGSSAANGTAQTAGSFWGEILDTIYQVRDGNEEPNALIWNTRLARAYAKATDTTGQPLQMPADVAAIQRYSSNQIPSYTKGTQTTSTDVFAGDFTKLIVGQRLDVTLQVLTERYAENGQIGIVAHWRGDVQPARSTAFAVHKALKGA